MRNKEVWLDSVVSVVSTVVALTVALGVLYVLNGMEFDVVSLLVFIYLTHILSTLKGVNIGLL